MTFNVLNRRIHSWGSIILALPMIVMIGSGLLLHVKKQWEWVQPREHRGTSETPVIGFAEILASVKAVEGLGVNGWDDVNRLDVRPGRGFVKVWLRNGHEVQVDLGTGRVLSSAYRRSDAIESIHDGSFFLGNVSKLGLFLPAGIVFLVLWLSGMWMFWVPYLTRWRRRP
jgi:uncharacterized iron-regulated membrane protein